MENYFTLVYESKTLTPYLYIKLLSKGNAQEAMKFIGNIILEVCNNETTKNSIILDCTELKKVTNLNKLNLGNILKLGYQPVGLEKFFIVTKSIIVKTFAKGIIRIKGAKEYTHVYSSLLEAVSNL